MVSSKTVRRTRRRLNQGGGDIVSYIWPFGSKKQQPPGGINWNQPTVHTQVNPIKTALHKYPIKRGIGARHLIPTRHELYRGPGSLNKKNNSTRKVKKGITFNPNLHLSNGSTLPRAINSNNTTTRYFQTKNHKGRVYNNIPNEELWSNPTNWAQSSKELEAGINVPEFINGPQYSRNNRNYLSHYATSALYGLEKPSAISKLPQFSKKSNSRKRLLENKTTMLLARKEPLPASNLDPDIEWKV
jgi:hypothetical protein